MGETGKWAADLLAFAVIVFLIFFTSKYILHVSWPFAVVSSWSMMPDLRVGDFILLVGAGSCSQIHVGDVIVYIASAPFPPGEWIVHRVIAQFQCQFTTKGDNSITNPISDQQYGEPPVTLGDVVGKLGLVIPYVGVFPLIVRPQSALGAGLWMLRLTAFIALVAAYYIAFKRIGRRKVQEGAGGGI